MGDAQMQPSVAESSFAIHHSAADIRYQPEDALKEGLAMVKTLKTNIKKLSLGSRLREDVWLREIEGLVPVSVVFGESAY